MGYIIGIILLVIMVPLLFLMLSRRTSSTGGLAAKDRDRGVTVSRPSAEEPTPRADGLNQPAPGKERRLQ
jgi:hypothetical protein